MDYVIHFCKNKACNNGWLDEDLFNAVEPPRWRYCHDCQKKGFKDRRALRREKAKVKS